MAKSDHRVVLDTNILVRAFINLTSNSGRIVKSCERRAVVPLLRGPVLGEYRFTNSSGFMRANLELNDWLLTDYGEEVRLYLASAVSGK